MSSASSPRERSRQPAPARGVGGPVRTFEKAANPRGALLRLIPYFYPFKKELILALLMVVAYTLLGLISPWLMGLAIDRFIGGGDAPGLARIVLVILAASLSTNFFTGASGWVMAGLSQRALKNMRRDLFTHLQSLTIGFFDTNSPGELMSRLTNDIDAINQAVSQNVTSLIAGVLSLVGIVVAMFLLNPLLATGSLLVVPILFWFTAFVARYTRKGYRALQAELGELTGEMEESIAGLKVVRAFRRGDRAVEDFRSHNQAVYRAAVYANTYAMLLMPISAVLANFFVIVLVGLGAWLALQGLATVGTIAAFIGYGQAFMNPLRQIANIYNAIQAALAGAERVFQVLDTPAETADAADARPLLQTRGHVRFEQVNFAYDPQKPVLKNVSLEALPGQTVALVGHTGAGKTTIINLLTRFYEPQSGRITIDGIDIRDIRRADLRKSLALVLQDSFLFSSSVMENIRYGRLDASDEEVIQAARLADAEHFINLLPQGFNTQLSERAGNLSQGQRQLLAIARAILADPAILILDEATSSVDTRTEARIQQSLLRLMHGRTSFVIAHRLSTIRDADNIIVIQDGEIAEQGRHQSLLERGGVFYQLYISQFKGQAI